MLNRTTIERLINLQPFSMVEDLGIVLGDTINSPNLLENSEIMTFDFVISNPPWSAPWNCKTDIYDRFKFGIPPKSNADWGWIQHMFASLKVGGMMTVLLSSGPLYRRTEKNIRSRFLDEKLIQGIIALPEKLFVNTNLSPNLLVITTTGNEDILFVDASQFVKKNRKINTLGSDNVEEILNIYSNWQNVPNVANVCPTTDCEDSLNVKRYTFLEEEEPIDMQLLMVEVEQCSKEVVEAEAKVKQHIFTMYGIEY
jgi:type I restriction enzyme M protein